MTSGSLGWWCIGKPALHCIRAIQLSQWWWWSVIFIGGHFIIDEAIQLLAKGCPKIEDIGIYIGDNNGGNDDYDDDDYDCDCDDDDNDDVNEYNDHNYDYDDGDDDNDDDGYDEYDDDNDEYDDDNDEYDGDDMMTMMFMTFFNCYFRFKQLYEIIWSFCYSDCSELLRVDQHLFIRMLPVDRYMMMYHLKH